MDTMNWVQLITAILAGLATAIPLVVKLVNVVQAAVKEKNWNQLLKMMMDYMTQAEKNFEIWVMADGGVYVDGIRQTGESLEQNIAAAVVANPGVRIHVIADRNTPYRYVDSVVQILQRLQHRVVSFVVQEVR